MARIWLRHAFPVICLALGGCGSARERYPYLATADCGTPNLYKFHGARVVMTETSPLPRKIVQDWVDGCAIVSFTLDSDGRIADPAVVGEQPPGHGIGDNAIAVLSRDVLVPQSEARFDTVAPIGAGLRYAMTVGFSHANGHFSIAKRTVKNLQTIRIGR